MNANHKDLVKNYIENIWNKKLLDHINLYLHATYVDHSLPPSLPPNSKGTQLWIEATSQSFENTTLIEALVAEEDKVVVKIKMLLKHIGIWRDIEPTHMELSTAGYRYFKLADGKIIAHWALIDGGAIENQLKGANQGCRIAE